MKNKTLNKKLGSIVLAATLLVGAVGGVAGGFALKANAEGAAEEKADKETVESFATDKISSLLKTKNGEGKEETVYIFTDSTGKQTKVLVNEKLNNPDSASQLKDVSTLSDILNLSGDEKFTQSGDNLTWDAQGNAITYQGTTTKQAPIDVKVTYTLDGKEISAEDLAGKSGHISMRFDYTNNEKRTIEVNGKESEAYVPFTVVTAMLLSEDHFANITVENGETSKLSSGTMVVGVALPGLNDSLNLQLEEKDLGINLDFPEYVVVEADTVDCEIDLMLTLASSSLVNIDSLEDVNTDNLKEKLEDLEDATEQLSDGADALVKGSSDLLDGTGKLKDGSKKLADGINEYTNGVSKVSDGVGQVADGAYKLDNGIGELESGINKVDAGAGSLASGIGSAKTGAESLDAGIKQVDAGAGNLADGATALADGVSQLTSGLSGLSSLGTAADAATAINTGINQLNTATSQTKTLSDEEKAAYTVDISQYGITIEALMAKGLTPEDAAVFVGTVQAIANGSLQTGIESGANTTLSTINGLINDSSSGASLVSGSAALAEGLQGAKALADPSTAQKISELNAGAAALKDGAASLKAGTSQLATGSASLVAGMGQLQSGANELSSGTSQLSSGAAQLKAGSSALVEGTSKLSGGVGQLTANSSALVSGSKELADGTVTLSEGAGKLHDGMVEMQEGVSQFKTEGIDKISELAEEDASNLVQRIKEVIKLGSDYQSFAGKPDDMDGSVVFIYRLPGIN